MIGANEVNLIQQIHKYMTKYGSENLVVKVGGHAMEEESTRNQILKDISFLKSIGLKPIIVHGGGPNINALLKQLGIESKFDKESGKRITDDATLDVTQYALGKLNQDMVGILNQPELNSNAIGISGADANLITADVAYGGSIGKVGEIKQINPEIIHMLLKTDFLPIVSPLSSDGKGGVLNVNADDTAVALAAKLKAKLVIMSDIIGVLADKDDPRTLIKAVDVADNGIQKMVDAGTIDGGMIPKLRGCESALRAGVSSISIIKGEPYSLIEELLTDEGIGTEIVDSSKKNTKLRNTMQRKIRLKDSTHQK